MTPPSLCTTSIYEWMSLPEICISNNEPRCSQGNRIIPNVIADFDIKPAKCDYKSIMRLPCCCSTLNLTHNLFDKPPAGRAAGTAKISGRPPGLLKLARISRIQRPLLGLRHAAITHSTPCGHNELPSPSEQTIKAAVQVGSPPFAGFACILWVKFSALRWSSSFFYAANTARARNPSRHG